MSSYDENDFLNDFLMFFYLFRALTIISGILPKLYDSLLLIPEPTDVPIIVDCLFILITRIAELKSINSST